jgi:hypothetical protein
MTVEELIGKLKEFNPKKTVLIFGDRDSASEDVGEVRELPGGILISQKFS